MSSVKRRIEQDFEREHYIDQIYLQEREQELLQQRWAWETSRKSRTFVIPKKRQHVKVLSRADRTKRPRILKYVDTAKYSLPF